MSDDENTVNVKGLENLIKALNAKPPVARVGILGSKGTRPDGGGLNNATIGAFHEFGTSKIPQRSFLRIPVAEHLEKKMDSSGAFDVDTIKEVMDQKTILPWMKKIATIAEGIVLEAFATGGFGKWQSWKNPNYHNNTGQILMDTTQLRNSITSEVK